MTVYHPRSLDPWRIVASVLMMTAFQTREPVTLGIAMK